MGRSLLVCAVLLAHVAAAAVLPFFTTTRFDPTPGCK